MGTIRGKDPCQAELKCHPSSTCSSNGNLKAHQAVILQVNPYRRGLIKEDHRLARTGLAQLHNDFTPTALVLLLP